MNGKKFAVVGLSLMLALYGGSGTSFGKNFNGKSSTEKSAKIGKSIGTPSHIKLIKNGQGHVASTENTRPGTRAIVRGRSGRTGLNHGQQGKLNKKAEKKIIRRVEKKLEKRQEKRQLEAMKRAREEALRRQRAEIARRNREEALRRQRREALSIQREEEARRLAMVRRQRISHSRDYWNPYPVEPHCEVVVTRPVEPHCEVVVTRPVEPRCTIVERTYPSTMYTTTTDSQGKVRTRNALLIAAAANEIFNKSNNSKKDIRKGAIAATLLNEIFHK